MRSYECVTIPTLGIGWMMHQCGPHVEQEFKELGPDVYLGIVQGIFGKKSVQCCFIFRRDAFIKAGNRWVPPAQPSRVGRMLTKTLEVYDIPVCP